jgi:outer membrane protein TolC
MVHECLTKKLIFVIICGLVGLCSLPGCTPSNYKKDADEKVYNIIDKKWKNEFGPKANYRISDVPPSPNDIQIEKVIPPNGVLTLSQAVALATAHNRDYQLQKEALYVKSLDLRLLQHNFERLYYGRPKGTYAKVEGVDYVGAGAGIEPRFNPGRVAQDLPFDRPGRPDGVELSIDDGFGFDQLLTDGTMIGTNVALSWNRILTGTLKGESLISVLSFEVAKPLLRGSDRRVVMESLTQAERDALYQVRLFNRFRKTFVVSVITQYYQVLQLFDAVKNARRNYNTVAWLYERVRKLADVGRLPMYEGDEAHQRVLQALDIYVQAERDYKQALDSFKMTLSLPPQAKFQLDPNELEHLRAVELTYPDFSEAESIETALSRRLDLVNSADAVIDAQRKVYVAADSLRAQLDLGVNTNIPLQDISSSNAKVFQDLYLSGLQLDLPFDRVAEQNIYRKALITLNQNQREYELAADTVALEIRTAYRDLVKAAQQYKIQLQSLDVQRKRFKDTYLLMQYGRANSRRVLDAQRDVFAAQNEAAQALVNYTVATLNFYRDAEVLQVRPDGMWEKNVDKTAVSGDSSVTGGLHGSETKTRRTIASQPRGPQIAKASPETAQE